MAPGENHIDNRRGNATIRAFSVLPRLGSALDSPYSLRVRYSQLESSEHEKITPFTGSFTIVVRVPVSGLGASNQSQ